MSIKPKRMILGLIPNKKCNFKCQYCYISQLPEREIFEKNFNYSIEHMAKCLAPNRLGGPCLINLTGEGETLLQRGIVELCEALLEQGHYIELVTNLSVTSKLDQLLKLPAECLKRMEFKISFHYDELNRLNLMEQFWTNVRKVQDSSCSFTIELMPHDGLIPQIDNIRGMCKKNVGADCQVTIGRADFRKERGILSDKKYDEYCDIWGQFASPMFEIKKELLNVKRKEFCYAGAWTLYVNMFTGETASCYDQPFRQNIFENPDENIKFHAVGCHCMLPYCINGHAHISLGVIPELGKEYSYSKIRNRVCENGKGWFKDDAEAFFGAKLYESNEEFSSLKKIGTNILWYFDLLLFVMKHPEKIKKRIKLWLIRRKNG